MIKAKRKKSGSKFCALCSCVDHKDMGPANGGNWDCPLLGEKICSTDCEIELEGGLGAPDILREVCKRTGKTPQEVHAVCVACPHGGKKLERTRKDDVEWNDRLRQLQGKKK